MPEIKIIHGDCMEYMATLKDKAFELAIVDPPYGWGDTIFDLSKVVGNDTTPHTTKKWNNTIPTSFYFNELFRVSINSIIWGGNYFSNFLPPSRCWIFWNKKYQGMYSFADGEFAFTTFDKNAQMFSYRKPETKIHPTQKPVALYQWLLKNYAKQGDKILDTHLGSGSSAIAADIMGFDFVGIEIDEDYYKAALDRFNRHKQQLTLEI